MTATNQERFMLDEADAAIKARLAEEVIAIARIVVANRPRYADASYDPRIFMQALDRLEELVGRP